MRRSVIANSILGAVMMMGCATDGTEQDDDELETSALAVAAVQQGNEIKLANQVNWSNAAIDFSTDPRSDYMRGQHLMARLAELAYKTDDAKAAQAMVELGFVPVKFIHEKAGILGKADVDAVLSLSNKQEAIFVSIRGSQESGDWLNDFLEAPSFKDTFGNGPQVTTHLGFTNYANAIFKELMAVPAFQAHCNPQLGDQRKPLWVTGHSLGGAVASILTDRLLKQGCNVRGAVTFGSPKPGFKDFKDEYQALRTLAGRKLLDVSTRWVYRDDPIPCLPGGGAWRHVGRNVAISKDGIQFLNDGEDCGDPNSALTKFKKSLILLAPHAAFPAVVQQWLSNDIVLEFLCNPNTRADDFFSLGLCTLHEKTGRLRSAFQLDPHELLKIAFSLIKANDHMDDNYVGGIPADFSFVPPGPATNVTVSFPDVDGRPFSMWDNNTNASCTTEKVGKRWECTFPSFVGNQIELHIATPKSRMANLVGCPGDWKSNTEYVCLVGSIPNQRVFFAAPY